MKKLVLILVLALLSGCTGYSYPVKDGGDGVYYAESPPVYTYVGGFYGFPYYGPYFGYWYNPVWYSPIAGPHYSWYRPYGNCALHFYCHGPGYMPSHGFAAYHSSDKRNKGKSKRPISSTAPLVPVGLEQMVITSYDSRYSRKNPAFYSAGMKSRYSAKSGRSAYASKYGTQSAYRPAVSTRSTSSPRYSRSSSRSSSSRHVPSRMVTTDDP